MQRRVRFGPFELDRHTGELWKHGLKVKLQGKPFQVLEALLERPGEPVSRELLQQKLWSGDTFVDFESGLNTAANRLRITLGDSAENPRYVETLARSGYRFVAHVEEVTEAAPPVAPPRNRRWVIPLTLAILVTGAVIWWTARQLAPEQPKFQQVTFRRGPVVGARFAPDGQTILYSAKWGEEPWRLFLASSVSPEARTLGFERSTLNAVSPSGELALLSWDGMATNVGARLSRVPMNGGSPLAVAERVVCADWSANGKELAAVRFEGFETQLEFPIGKVLYRTANLMSCVRVSRDGSMLAFMEHPVRNDDGGDIKVVDLAGKVRTLSAGWASAGGLAWSASGNEVWFTAARTGGTRALWAVTLTGKLRLVSRVPGSLRLEDISRDGHVLVARQDRRLEMWGRVGNDPLERDLSWFDWSGAADLSADGSLVLFDESGEGGGANWTVYLRRSADGSITRLAEGHALALAPDGRSALVLNGSDRRRVTLVPVGEGRRHELSGADIEYHWARFFPDGQRLLVAGNEPGGKQRLYVQAIDGGKPQPLAPDIYLRNLVISPDGKQIAGTNRDSKLVVLAAGGGHPQVLQTEPDGLPVSFSADGRSLVIRDWRGVPAHLYRVDLATGRSKRWRDIGPSNAEGIIRLFYTPDERSYVYSFIRSPDTLYVASGWK
jgi:DNA-binding winged helix-turn-helix (wHTH) protein/Tol biopolymer transport system component